MEAMRYQVECGHLSIRDGMGFWVDSAIELTPHAEPGRGTGGANEIDDHRETHQRLATPVGADVGKEPVLDLDRKSTRLNSSHIQKSRMPSSA